VSTDEELPENLTDTRFRFNGDPVSDSQRAFLTMLYLKYRGPLYRHVKRIIPSQDDAAELVQETYVRVMKQAQISSFEAAARNYLYQTATNLARDWIRRKYHRRHETLDDESSQYPMPTQTEPDYSLAWLQAQGCLRAAITALPLLTRNIFVMSRMRDMQYSEISAALNISLRTVERKMQQAMSILATRLKDSL